MSTFQRNKIDFRWLAAPKEAGKLYHLTKLMYSRVLNSKSRPRDIEVEDQVSRV